jgi:hypothetical protein
MAEVSPPRALDPAARTTNRRASDNPSRISPSAAFRGLLRGPISTPHLAHGPAAVHGHAIGVQTDGESLNPKHRSQPRRGDGAGSEQRTEGGNDELLDPLWCQMAAHPGINPTVVTTSASLPDAVLPLREDLQNLLTGLARRVAWGGERRKGSARIELSEGALAGATLVVHTEQRSVSVEIELPEGSNAGQGLQQRILDRLERRGFAARVRIE